MSRVSRWSDPIRTPRGAAAAWMMALAVAWMTTLVPAPALAMSTQAEDYEAALRLTPRLDHGAKLFELCDNCHGRDGAGSAAKRVPAIAGESVPVLLRQLVEFRYDARHSIRVQGFMDHHRLTPQGLADVAAYVNMLPPRQPSAMRESPGAAHGAMLYESLCGRCHGLRGEGESAALVPRLAGQHRAYLAEQLHDAAEGRRPSMLQDHSRVLARLTGEEMDQIAEYLAGITPGARAAAPSTHAPAGTAEP